MAPTPLDIPPTTSTTPPNRLAPTHTPLLVITKRSSPCDAACRSRKTVLIVLLAFLILGACVLCAIAYGRHRQRKERRERADGEAAARRGVPGSAWPGCPATSTSTSTTTSAGGGAVAAAYPAAVVGVRVNRGADVELDGLGDAPPSYGEAVRGKGFDGKGAGVDDIAEGARGMRVGVGVGEQQPARVATREECGVLQR